MFVIATATKCGEPFSTTCITPRPSDMPSYSPALILYKVNTVDVATFYKVSTLIMIMVGTEASILIDQGVAERSGIWLSCG
jgi:hypothetical protein